MSSPYLNPADSFLITRSVNLPQLEAEVIRALDDAEHFFTLTGPVTPTADSPAQLWVQPPVPPDRMQAVQSAVETHRPDSGWGIPTAVRAYQALETKILADPEVDLSVGDLRDLVVGLVLKSHNPLS